jgi:predicted ATPase
LTIYYGQWLANLVGGQIGPARTIAETYLGEAKNAGSLQDIALASRLIGQVGLYQGALFDARMHLEAALASYDPTRDIQVRLGQGADIEIFATVNLAMVFWQLGEVERARELTELAKTHAVESGRPSTVAHTHTYTALFEAFRGDADATLRDAKTTAQVAGLEIPMYPAMAKIFQGWARARLSDREAGLEELRQGLTVLAEKKIMFLLPVTQGLLSELEADGPSADAALARIDEALRLATQTGERWTDAFLYRIRGDIQLKADPKHPARALEAYLSALAIAREQGARSFGLQAALGVAKLYQSTGRPADAHAVLAPALEGFSPTPEMSEIAEAQALLAALAESDEVKSAAASRQRRLQLQTRYGQAMMYSRGFASDESKTAFASARTLAAGVGDASERFDAYYGLFVGSVLRGELSLARETAESFLRAAENEGRMMEAAVARRCVGIARLWQGDFIDARTNLAEALRTYDPKRDRDAKFRFGVDAGAAATGFLAVAGWAFGDVERARALSEEALARADETAHAPSRAFVYTIISLYQLLRGDPESARRAAMIPVDLGREHAMALWLAFGEVLSYWARARLGDRESGIVELREALAAYLGQKNRLHAPLFQGQLAELEADGDNADGALRRIDEALARASETGEHWTDALLHRIRGAILLKRDPANPAPAEEAFLAAIAIAQAQKARSFELLASLSLAKLYQATTRPADAHAVLAPALEGFAPTPEMPEIAEAQALMDGST